MTDETEPQAPVSRWTQWRTHLRSVLPAVGLLLVGGFLGAALDCSDPTDVVATPQGAGGTEESQIWTCSMHPQIRMQDAGQCPVCGMDLVPVTGASAEHAGQPVQIELSDRAKALARIKTEDVTRTEPRVEVRLLGHVDYDETRLRTITPWTAGRIDQLRVRVTGAKIGRGQVVAKLYSPEIYAAMRDLALAKKQAGKLDKAMHGAGTLGASALESARQRVRLLGVSDAQIDQIENTGKAPKTVDVRASFPGTVIERLVEAGDYVSAGTPLYNVADLSRVWIQIDAYESDLPHIQVGQEVVVEVESLPGEPLTGRVAFIDPVVDMKLRTARVRVEVDNSTGQLRPGMFAEAVIQVGAKQQHSHLVIPATAPLFTGRRSVVYVEVPGTTRPTYELREVRLGPKSGPVYPVLSGLSEGERVVTRGAFVLDADLQLSGGLSMMTRGDDTVREQIALKVPPELRETIAPIVSGYVDAQAKLADDDVSAARTLLESMAATINEVDPPGPKATREAWHALASKLAGESRRAASASTDGEVRTAFEHISMQIEDLLHKFGNPLSEPLRVAYCPMAFDNKGAAWVQRDEAVANPYYGAAMLRCGDFRATVLPGERLATAKAPPRPAARTHEH